LEHFTLKLTRTVFSLIATYLSCPFFEIHCLRTRTFFLDGLIPMI
jgi:hypothetical protein